METVLERALTRWSQADLVSDDQAAAIRDFEAERAPASSRATAADPDGEGERSSLVAEGLAYMGAAIAFGAALAVFGEIWSDLGSAGRVALSLVGTAIVGAAAFTLRDHRSGSLARLCTVLAALSVVGTALSAFVVLDELTTLDADWATVFAGFAGLAAGAPVHLARASWPTTLALGGSVLTVVFGGQELLGLLDGAFVPGVTLMGLGLAWAASGWSGHARPRSAFEVTGLLVGGAGVQALAFEDGAVIALVVGLLVAAGALAVGLAEDRTSPAVLGGLGLTVFSPQLVLELFGDTVGGPLALFVGGIVLVAASVVVLRQQEVLA